MQCCPIRGINIPVAMIEQAESTPSTPPKWSQSATTTSAPPSALHLFLGYRVFVATAMLVLFFVIERGPLGTHAPTLFALAVLAYSAFSIGALMLGIARPAKIPLQATLAMVVDLLLFTLMMYASGGVTSGVGILIAISIALGANIIEQRLALAFAAIASLTVIGEEFLAHAIGAFAQTAYVQAGLLGIAYFLLVLLVLTVSARARRSELLAEQREIELIDLAQLNDYVIQQMQSGIVVVDRDDVVQMLNESAWVLLGMPSVMRHHPLETVAPALAQGYRTWRLDHGEPDALLRIASGGRDLRAHFQRIGQKGNQGTLITLEDVSVVAAQAQQMKLASLGRLTGGIAHEVRNPLGAISHAAQLLNESPATSEPDRRLIEIILQNSSRVNEVIESILKLSRQDLAKPKPLVLGPWLRELVAQFEQACSLQPGQLTIDAEPWETTVYADSSQLKQIIEVLCDNAIRHFQDEPPKLRLAILAGIDVDSGGPYLEFRDNGPGIPNGQVEQLFEPFFTTSNEGTGLGLYIARQLSEANRMRIEYRPLPQGSCFRLSFPNPRRRELA